MCPATETSLIDILRTENDDDFDDEAPNILNLSPYYDNDNAIELLKEKSDTISILSLNCQSLSAKFEQLKIYIEQFEISKCPFTIICLQETWLSDNHDVSLFQIDGYKFIHKPRSCSAHGGVAIYLRGNLEYKILGIGGDSEIWDELFIEVIMTNDRSLSNRQKIVIGNLYRPPRDSLSNYDKFFSDLEEILSHLQVYKEVILTGDFNLDLLKIKESTHVNNFFETVMSNGYIPKITFPTRITSHSSTLIDNCLVKMSSKFSITTAGILNYNISDHQPYFVTLDYLKTSRVETKLIRTYAYTTEAMSKFKNDIKTSCNIGKFSQDYTQDPNNNYKILNDLIQHSLDKHLSSNWVRCDKYKHKKCRWITSGIMRSIRFRDKLYNKLRSTPVLSENYNKYKINLQTYNRILKQNIRLAKKLYYHDCFNKFKNDIKNTWSMIKQIINKNCKGDEFPKYFQVNDKTVSDPKSIANEFNQYFINIGPALATEIIPPENKTFKDYLNDTTCPNFEFSCVNEKTVVNAINDLKPKSSSGVDKLSNKLLKVIKDEICKPLTIIVNQCFSTGIFPDALKVARVLPIYKKKENYLFDNYRPVSILPSISKVLEKLMHAQLYDHFTSSKLFYDSQYGFRNKHSTELAALEIIHRIVNKMDKKEIPINIYLDLSKAFDTLDHTILTHKLKHYGLIGKSLSLLEDYLSNRKQYVEYKNTNSDYKLISTGVPQGSILGPLLFIIYLNDLAQATNIFEPIIYADDTALCATLNAFGSIDHNLETKINEELIHINDWFKLNKLSLNASKTKAMYFHSQQRRPEQINIIMNDIRIDFVENFNYLGIILDTHLSWKPHLETISQKISKTIGIMSKLKNFIPSFTLLTLYNSLILPYLNYGILAWGIKSHRLFKLQKKSVRIIVNAKYNSHTDPIFKNLSLLKISDLCALQELKFVYKLKNQILPNYFLGIQYPQHLDIHNYYTRNSQNLVTFQSKHAFVANSIIFRIPNIVNNCPQLIKEKITTHSITGFSQYVKNHFLSKYGHECQIVNCYVCNSVTS